MSKSNSVTIENRVSIVIDMLLAGDRRSDIIQNCRKATNWNVCDKTIDSYIKKGKEHLYKPVEKNRERLKNKIFAQYEYLYKKMVSIKDYRAAASVLDKMAALTGINEPGKKDDVTHVIDFRIQ